jgi:hypothetical protein
MSWYGLLALALFVFTPSNLLRVQQYHDQHAIRISSRVPTSLAGNVPCPIARYTQRNVLWVFRGAYFMIWFDSCCVDLNVLIAFHTCVCAFCIDRDPQNEWCFLERGS